MRLDVTKPEEIAAAVESVAKAGRGLYGLVNNAGVAIAGPLVETKEEDFHWVMNANVYGPFRVTKAFSPLIVADKGRIATISSISGILSRGGTTGPRLTARRPTKYPEPDDVADAVLHFLSDANPKHRYMVVPVQAEAEVTIRKAIQELVRLNERQRFSYDRNALVEMLDAELGRARPAN